MNNPNLNADKYTHERAHHYEAHHRKSLRTSVTTWRERALLKNALAAAGNPARALDLPCGTGRFWPAFADAGVKELLAADNSAGMLGIAARSGAELQIPVKLFKTSVFQIGLPAASVQFLACLRFFHHLSRTEDRARALAEIRRVTTSYAAISLWTDGNVQSWLRSRRRDKPVVTVGYGKRTCLHGATFEAEVKAAGFEVAGRWRLWPGLSMWTLYLIRKP